MMSHASPPPDDAVAVSAKVPSLSAVRGLASRWLAALAVLSALTAWNWGRDPVIAEAERALTAGDPLAAARLGYDALTRHPDDPRALRAAARGLSLLAYAREAEPLYERARGAGGLGPDDLKGRASGWMRANGRERALAAYREALGSRPGDVETMQQLATLLWLMGRPEEALAMTARPAADPASAPLAYALQATIHHERGRSAESIAAAELALARDPDGSILAPVAPTLWAEYAADLMAVGRGDEARRHLEAVTSRFDTPELWNLLGRLDLEAGRLEEAERHLRTSAARDPNRAAPWLDLGRLAARQGRPGEAAEDFERASTLDPTSLDAYYQLGLARRRLGEVEAARAAEAKAQAIRGSRRPPAGKMGPATSPAP